MDRRTDARPLHRPCSAHYERFTFFYFGHVFLPFLTFYFPTVFLFFKNVGKVQSGKQINKKHFQNNSNEIDL